MLSHICNATVLQVAGEVPLTQTLQIRQVNRLVRTAQLPAGSLLRDCVFEPGSTLPKVFAGKRRVGCPRLNWCTVVYAHAHATFVGG